MLNQFQTFIRNLAQRRIEIINKRLNKLFQSYSFYYISQENNLDQDFKLNENIQFSKLIILDYYEQDPHFIVGFQNTIQIIPMQILDLVYPLVFNNKEICFLNDKTKAIFDEKNKLKYTEYSRNDNFQIEISNFNCNFRLSLQKIKSSSKEKTEITNIFTTILSCITGYLIQTSYIKLKKNRISNFYSCNQHKIRGMIEKEDYIELRSIGFSNSSHVFLIFLIESEELLAIKKFNNINGESQKLIDREIRNYKKINHPFLSRYYGETKENHIIFEYINGSTLSNIKEYHFSEEEKLTIIFQLLSVIDYLHENHFIYRDLKPNNVMIDENKTAVLIDFDRMIIEKEKKTNESNTKYFGTIFQAPDIFCNDFNNKCDIYSIGQMIFYLINEQNPTNLESINISIFENNSILSMIYEKCINIDPAQRPSAIELIHYFCYFVAKTNIIFENIDSKAQFILGVIYEKDKSIPRDINKSIYYYSLAAKQNNLDAQYNLGVIYEQDKSISRDINKAIYYYSLAANQNDSEAQFNLGVIYEQDKSISRDINKAIYYYSLAANQNNSKAQFNLGLIYYKGESIPRDINKAIYYYSLAADHNHSKAQLNLGCIYHKGELIQRDINKAIYYYSLAANQNISLAQFNLGYIYHKGKIPRDINKAIYYYSLAADHNHSKAQFNLGYIYYKDESIPRDINKAIHYFSLAANQKDSEAQFFLGVIYYEGESIPRDINKAIYYFSVAANQNHSQAQFNLGYIYYKDESIPRDINKAIYYFLLAENQNNSQAQFFLGVIYDKGAPIPRDIKKSIYYYSLAANQNHLQAQFNLGVIYYKGESIPRDINKAIYYFLLAANQKHPIAQFNLGYIYYKGESISRDINKTIYYYSLAANQNDSKAQFFLGVIYYLGIGVQRNAYKGIDLIMQSHFPLAFFYHEGKYLKRDIKKSVSLYKEGSSFNDQYSKNNLGILYKNGFGNEFEKKWPISIIYFEEAIKQKNDFLSKYNLSHVYIYEESTSESIRKSIKYLVESFESGFEPSGKLLCLVLIKLHGISIDDYEKEISKYTNNIEKFIVSLRNMIEENELYLSSNFDKFYEKHKYIDFLYNELKNPFHEIFRKRKKNQTQKSQDLKSHKNSIKDLKQFKKITNK